jgi:hypothetical protein
MKKPPDNPEFVRFTDAMRHIMTVPKTAIRERDEEEKKKAKRDKTQETQTQTKSKQ